MPDDDALAAMYGPSYAGPEMGDDVETVPLVDRLMSELLESQAGVFLDYGCGGGGMLIRARAAGWNCYGVELDPEVAEETTRQTGVPVVVPGAAADIPKADVIFLGDVIEHLRRPRAEIRKILALGKPRTMLVAQGPLDNNPNVFNLALRAKSHFSSAPISIPPYHVTMATSRGQLRLFEGLGLDCLKFVVVEVAWPAPSKLRDVTDVRGALLVTLRRLSQIVTRVNPLRLGNRYFYVGRTSRAATV